MQSEDKHEIEDVVVAALRPFGTSIFTEMSVLANAHGAVNLSQGFPDFDGPEAIRAKASEAIKRGPNQYVLSYGMPALREAVARKMERFYGVTVDADREVTVTSGATEGLCATLLGILETGDEVILLEPSYETYAPVSAMAKAKIRYVSLEGPEFSLPREKLAAAFNPKTKAIIINNPQNPCCKTFSREELSFIGGLCAPIWGPTPSGTRSMSIWSTTVGNMLPLLTIPELKDRCFVISSTAKTFSMTGWKIGYVIAAPALTLAVRMSHQFITFCGQGPLQEAMTFAIDYRIFLLRRASGRLHYYDGTRPVRCPWQPWRFQVFPTAGTYYLLVDIRSLGWFEDDVMFCRMLTEKAGVAAIPCSCFWNNRGRGRELVRFCFCKKDETLDKAIKRPHGIFGKR